MVNTLSVQQPIVERMLAKIQESLKMIHQSEKRNKIDVAVRFVSIATQSFFLNSKVELKAGPLR